jgi:hypothetical protein
MRESTENSAASAGNGISLARLAAAPKQDAETRKLRRENSWFDNMKNLQVKGKDIRCRAGDEGYTKPPGVTEGKNTLRGSFCS